MFYVKNAIWPTPWTQRRNRACPGAPAMTTLQCKGCFEPMGSATLFGCFNCSKHFLIYLFCMCTFIQLLVVYVCVCVCVEHLNRCKTSTYFFNSRGTGADLPIQSNEAMAFRWMSGLINHLHLHFYPLWHGAKQPLQPPFLRSFSLSRHSKLHKRGQVHGFSLSCGLLWFGVRLKPVAHPIREDLHSC